jgi:rod shape-determining protein MreC
MENILSRHRNVSILVAVLFAQVLGLAVQVKRAGVTGESQDTRLIRVWTVRAVTPFEKSLVWMQSSTSGLWHNYFYLRGVRAENRELKQQIEQMRIEQVRLSEDAEQARRLQLLLDFREKFISKTVAAQVVGTSGSEQSRSVYIDKGRADGVKPDQAVITANGIVGKVLHVYDDHTSNVLLVNDQTSGVGVILEKSRLQGILRGTANGELAVEKIMSDETVQAGERVLTSGGDQIFPKGLEVGTVSKVAPGKDSFLDIRLRPAASLSKLEEVLVVTRVEDRSPTPGEVAGPIRAVDILTRRLPSVPDKPATPAIQGATKAAQGTTTKPGVTGQSTAGSTKPMAVPGSGGQVAAQSGPKQGATGSVGVQQAAPKPLTGSATGPGTTAKPAKSLSTDSREATPGQKTVPGGAPAATKSGVSTDSPAKPTEVKKSPVEVPQNPGAPVTNPNAKLPSASNVKPVSAQAGAEAAAGLKPAVVQKTATPATKTADQSAKPAAPQAKPANKVPAEDNPQ